jgi:hypothetical protein
MSFTHWLRNLRSAIAPGQIERNHRRRQSGRGRATRRLEVETLERRDLPSYAFTPIDPPDSISTNGLINERLNESGINDSGQIVGRYVDAIGTTHGFLRSGGSYTTLDVPGSTFTVANGINASGQIVGAYYDPASDKRYGFLLSGGSYTTLDVAGSTLTAATGINDAGQIVGHYFTPGVTHGFLLSGGSYTTFDVPDSNNVTRPNGINASGQIVGGFLDANVNRGFLLSGGSYTTFDVPDSTFTWGHGINAVGQIVGQYIDAGGTHGFLLSGGSYTTLDVPGSTLTAANEINASGQIVGKYLDENGISHGFLATLPARVESVVVNDGSAQRSMVNSLTVTFDSAVTLDSGAFEVRPQGGSPVGVSVATSEVGGRTIAVLTFTGSDIIGGSLADGSYTLTVRADRVHDRWGLELDGDGNGLLGGDRVDGLFRLFGDGDGDRDLDGLDRGLFRSAFGKGAADVGYLWYFEFDGDGDVDGLDNGQFNRRFGQF